MGIKIRNKKAIYVLIMVITILSIVSYVALRYITEPVCRVCTKDCDERYEDASLEYFNKMAYEDKLGIYLAIIGNTKYQLLFDSLYNNAGSTYGGAKYRKRIDKNFSIPFDKKMKQDITNYWKRKHSTNMLINDVKEYAIYSDDTIIQIKEPYWIVKLGPIKLVDGNIVVGYESWAGPLAGRWRKFVLIKKHDKWEIIGTWGNIVVS
ncbi:MAG: hypothetical protein ACM3SM_04670 [Bacteroidota bacterium]